MAFRLLLSAFLQLGHTRVISSVLSSFSSVKLTVTSVLRESLCGWSSEEAGHIGVSFVDFGTLWRVLDVFEDGVREGTQKDGSRDLEASV